MGPANQDEHLSRVKTQWTLVFQAHKDADTAAAQALLLRYYGAAYRYLLGTLRDATAAEDLTQEFAVRFLRGDFQRADPKRGRFRDFLKTSLRHLVIDHWRRKGKAVQALPADSLAMPAAPADDSEDLDRAFLEKWREELLGHTWQALQAEQDATGQPYHTVLRWRAEDPQVRSAAMAERLRTLLGRTFSEVGVRQVLYRARQRFAELLVDEVGRSLPGATPADVEQELIELNLLDYCQSALQRRAEGGSS
jgi:RNA polymerase sigma-70 factor (ECF subfamily)